MFRKTHNDSSRKGKYLLKNPFAFFLLRCIDFFLPSSKPSRPPTDPKRILICNLAHLGDIVIATSFLKTIKDTFPLAEIGFLMGSWAKPVLKEHPLVQTIHIIDHWKLNRSSLPVWKKVLRYIRTRKLALKEIKQQAYDIAFDLYFYFPNALYLLWKAKIPTRIGYTSGGFGALLTHPFPWTEEKKTVSERQHDLLHALSLPSKNYSYSPFLPVSAELIDEMLPPLFHEKGFIVCHAGPSSSPKSWPQQHWKILIQELLNRGFFVVLTGQGDEEKDFMSQLVFPHVLNLCNSLHWKKLISLLSKARLLISIDSVPVHVTSGFSTPTLVLFSNKNDPFLWAPLHPSSITLMSRTSSDLVDISPQKVLKMALKLLE